MTSDRPPTGDFDDEIEELSEWLDGYERSSAGRKAPLWAASVFGADDYDVLCENCGRNMPCRNCAE
jgi:hypothetical protein